MGKIQGLPSFQKLPWHLPHDVLEHFAWVSLWTATPSPQEKIGKGASLISLWTATPSRREKIGKRLKGGGGCDYRIYSNKRRIWDKKS